MAEIIAFIVFVVSMAATPGPVNLVAFSAGVNFSYRRSIPFILGAATGFASMVLSLGLGMIELFNAFPGLMTYLSWLGAAFIIYLGIKIVRSKPDLEVKNGNCPSYFDALLMQWLNPKCWAASMSQISLFMLADSHSKLMICAGATFCLAVPSVSLWAYSGDRLQWVLQQPQRVRYLNYAMGLGLIVVAVGLVLMQSGELTI